MQAPPPPLSPDDTGSSLSVPLAPLTTGTGPLPPGARYGAPSPPQQTAPSPAAPPPPAPYRARVALPPLPTGTTWGVPLPPAAFWCVDGRGGAYLAFPDGGSPPSFLLLPAAEDGCGRLVPINVVQAGGVFL